MSIDNALRLAGLGFRVFPLLGKIPPKGLLWKEAASTDPQRILIEFAPHAGANVGIACGGMSRLFVLDVDGADGWASLDGKQLPQTYTVKTGREGGFHLYMRWPDGVPLHTISKGKLGNGLDTRCDGGYVVAPGSVHPETGAHYEIVDYAEIAEVPQWIVDWLATKEIVRAAVNAPHIAALSGGDKIERRARAYLDKIEGAVAGQGGHDATYKAALAMVRGFALPESTALALMQDYNARCSPPWSEQDLARKVSQAAKADRVGAGWLLNETRHTFDDDESHAADAMIAALMAEPEAPVLHLVTEADEEAAQTEEEKAAERITAARAKKDTAASRAHELVESVRALGGLCETFTGWVMRSSIYPQPEIAIGALLSLGSALFSRRCLTASGVGLNTYVLAIGESGTGKGRPQACLFDALADWSHVKGPGVFSSTKSTVRRIADTVAAHGCGLLCVQDEYGVKFTNWVQAKMGHQAEIRSLLLEMSTKWGGTFSTGTSSMDGGEDLTIIAPAISVFGSTTPSTIEAAFRGASVLDGLAGRHLVMRCLPRLPERNKNHSDHMATPEVVTSSVERVRKEHEAWLADLPCVQGKSIKMYVEQKIKRDAVAQTLFEMLSDRIDHERRESTDTARATLEARRSERVECVEALLACLAEVSGLATVRAEHHKVACAIVELSMTHLANAASDADMRSSDFGITLAKVADIIKDNPRGISRSALVRRVRWLSPKDLTVVLEALRDSDTVEEIRGTKSANGKQPLTYVWKE